MRAIRRIQEAGLTTAQIAAVAHTTTHAIRNYVHMRRFPNQHVYTALVRLAESRGVTLLAADFITDGTFVSSKEID